MKVSLSNITDEAVLVKGCQNNEATAQRLLYNKYVEDMLILCLRYIPGIEDAKEVLMDAFLNFFKNISSFTYQGGGSVKAWLKKITINQCLMHLRKQRPVFTAGDDIEKHTDTESGDDILGHLAVKEILKLLHTMPDGYRIVFNLYVFEGKNHSEIGELLGISEGTSKSQLHRAKALLKEKITQNS